MREKVVQKLYQNNCTNIIYLVLLFKLVNKTTIQL